MSMNMNTVGNRMIAWQGNPLDTVYIIPENLVNEFLRKFNDHGNWQVLDNRQVFVMDVV